MKLKFLPLAVGLLLSLCAAALSQSISQTQFSNGYAYKIEVSSEDLKDTPAWNPEKGNVAPLSLRRAIQVGRSNLKRFAPHADDKWDVEKVVLHQMGKERWLYEVEFYCFMSKCGEQNHGFTIYIKMDGKIIEPEKTLDNRKQSILTEREIQQRLAADGAIACFSRSLVPPTEC